MIISYPGISPKMHASVFVAEDAHIVGDVKIGEDGSVWFNSVVRGDVNFVRIGKGTNAQDNCVLHVTHQKHPLQLPDRHWGRSTRRCEGRALRLGGGRFGGHGGL